VPGLLTDIRYGARALRRSATFTANAVAALSLGIAAATAIFSVANKVLLEPLPYPHAGRLVQLITESELGNQHVVSIPKYDTWRDHTDVFEYIAAYDTTGPQVNLNGSGLPQPLEAARVTPGYFPLFGADVLLGRTFSTTDERGNAGCLVIVSENLWRTRFGADPRLVGSAVSLDYRSCRVIGVLTSGFEAGRSTDVWLPLQIHEALDDHLSRVRVAGRLRPGVTIDLAAGSVAKTMRWFLHRYKYAPLLFNERFTAIPLRDAVVGDVRRPLLLLSGAVAFVLLIACANTGSLVLARAGRRVREIAVRSALGARRSQLMRQLLTESMLMALASGLAGLLLGFAAIRALLALSPADLPRAGMNGAAITLDWRVFVFTFVVSLSSGVICGLIPAVKASRSSVISLVNQTGVPSGMGFRRSRGGSLLVISQVALALVLLAGAGLLIRRFIAMRTVDRGFHEQNVLTAQMSLTGPQFESTAHVAELVGKVERRLRKNPGILMVAATSSLPLEPAPMMPYTVTRRDQSKVGRYHGVASWRSVSPRYFDALRIRLLRGRLFTSGDGQDSARVVLINRTMMKKVWQEVDANPVGEFIVIGRGLGAGLEDVPRQIVGVVSDTRDAGLDPEAMVYVPVAQLPDALNARNNRVLPVAWVIRTTGDLILPALMGRDLQEAAGLPVANVRTMRQVVAVSSARAQFYTSLLSVFAVTGLLLAAVGLYGVMTCSVQQRTREIGLRMALGAGPDRIRRMVVWQGMRLALAGIAVGIPAAAVLTRVMVSLIFGLRPWDSAVFAVVSALLAAVAFTAAYFPSARAAEVHPSESLRG
jgi:predicted permease